MANSHRTTPTFVSDLSWYMWPYQSPIWYILVFLCIDRCFRKSFRGVLITYPEYGVPQIISHTDTILKPLPRLPRQVFTNRLCSWLQVPHLLRLLYCNKDNLDVLYTIWTFSKWVGRSIHQENPACSLTHLLQTNLSSSIWGHAVLYALTYWSLDLPYWMSKHR